MAKVKSTKTDVPVISITDIAAAAKKLLSLEKEQGRSVEIREARIKDDFCLYQYEEASGKTIGFKHKVDGKGIIEDDLRNAFARLNVHMAFIDDIFTHSRIKVEDIDTLHNDELTMLYTCTGFKIQGGEENESIILTGNKYLSGGARMEITTPKIAIDSLSSYKWHNELKTEADKCREEVALYHYGKFTPVQVEEDEDDPRQGSIFSEEQPGGEHEMADMDLEAGKV